MRNTDEFFEQFHKSERLPVRTAVTLRHLRCAVAVAEARSFTRAAGRLCITQSTLTTSIQQLEQDIGVRIFDRTTRSVVATPAASRFLERAARLLKDFDSMIGDMRSVIASTEGHLRIAAAPSAMNWLLIPALPHFEAAYPEVTISLRDTASESVDLRVLEGDVDFGISNDPSGNPELDYAPIFRDIYGVICSPDHPLTRRQGDIQWEALQHYKSGFIRLDADTRLGQFHRGSLVSPLLETCSEEVSSSNSLYGMLSLGRRFSIVPALTAKTLQLDDFPFRVLSPPVFREVSLVTRKLRSLSPSAIKLGEALLTRLKTVELPTGIQLYERSSEPHADSPVGQ
jgi:DNA-binding transcriptional LysR family regulator